MQISYYELIGNETLKEMIALFYEEVRLDELLLPMYPGDLEAAEKRLYLFLVQYLGGPAIYSQRRGHPRLRKRHETFYIDEKAKDHWLACMKTAMDKVELTDGARRYLWSYFEHTANFLINKSEK